MARTNLQIKTGTYTGDGNDSRNITGIGFRPRLLVIKGGSNAAIMRTDLMPGDLTAQFPASANIANAIQEILNDGFQIGTDVRANANGTVYTYVAFNWGSSQSYMRTLKYIGDGTTPRTMNAFGLNFTPDILMTFSNAALGKVFKTSDMPTNTAARFDANANTTAAIIDLIANGATLGSATTANQSTTTYDGFAMRNTPGVSRVGILTGTGAARSITGLGFAPSVVFVKRSGASACALSTSNQAADTTMFLTAIASSTNCITSLGSDGFSLGTDDSVNKSGDTYYWFAFAAGNFNVPITRSAS